MGIAGNEFEDFCSQCWCCPCALTQEYLELKDWKATAYPGAPPSETMMAAGTYAPSGEYIYQGTTLIVANTSGSVAPTGGYASAPGSTYPTSQPGYPTTYATAQPGYPTTYATAQPVAYPTTYATAQPVAYPTGAGYGYSTAAHGAPPQTTSPSAPSAHSAPPSSS